VQKGAQGAHSPWCAIVAPAARATQALLYVVPLQPHTSSMTGGQMNGVRVQTPSASGAQAPSGFWQVSPDEQGTEPAPPHVTAPPQGPRDSTATPAASAPQELS